MEIASPFKAQCPTCGTALVSLNTTCPACHQNSVRRCQFLVPIDISDLEKAIRDVVNQIPTDGERLGFFEAIMINHCRHCGAYDGHSFSDGKHCRCTNDS